MWVLAALMLGSMCVSVLVNVSHLGDRACGEADCAAARTLLPWLVVGAGLAALWSVARMLGPIAVSPGVASWLVPSPVDRGELLRSRMWAMTALSGATVAPVAMAVATLGGWHLQGSLLLTAGAAGLAAFGVGALVHAQPRRRHPALLLGPSCLAAVGLGLVAIALDRTPVVASSEALVVGALVLCGVLWIGVVLLSLRAVTLTGRLRRSHVAPGGALAPGLGGALASLDLALMFDVVLAHGSRARAAVRPVRGGPSGLAALVWRDLVRVRRNLGKVALLVGSLAVPYAVAAVGGGVVTVLSEVVVCFGFVLPLLVSLRVLTRSRGMVRIFPTAPALTRAATLVVPGLLVLGHGLLSAPALHRTLDGAGREVSVLGLAAGLGGLAAAVRWVTGRPPDYGRPLIASPAGAVPTNLYGSVLRGLDVVLLAAVPMLLAPTVDGALVSMLLSCGVLAYLCGRR